MVEVVVVVVSAPVAIKSYACKDSAHYKKISLFIKNLFVDVAINFSYQPNKIQYPAMNEKIKREEGNEGEEVVV